MEEHLKNDVEKHIQNYIASKELESHERLLQEVNKQREFLRKQFQGLVWIFGIALGLVAVVFGIILPQRIEQAVDAKVIEYEIVESYKKQLEVRVRKVTDDASMKLTELSDSIAINSYSNLVREELIKIVAESDIDSLANIGASIKFNTKNIELIKYIVLNIHKEMLIDNINRRPSLYVNERSEIISELMNLKNNQ